MCTAPLGCYKKTVREWVGRPCRHPAAIRAGVSTAPSLPSSMLVSPVSMARQHEMEALSRMLRPSAWHGSIKQRHSSITRRH